MENGKDLKEPLLNPKIAELARLVDSANDHTEQANKELDS